MGIFSVRGWDHRWIFGGLDMMKKCFVCCFDYFLKLYGLVFLWSEIKTFWVGGEVLVMGIIDSLDRLQYSV